MYSVRMTRSLHGALALSSAVTLVLLLSGCNAGTHRASAKCMFLEACGNGSAGEVEALLNTHPSLAAAADVHGWTGLHRAAMRGNVATLEVLLKHGANTNAPDVLHWTPLFYAALRRHLKAAQRLVAAGADVNLADKDHTTPLHIAVMRRDLPMAKLLVRAGADVNASQTTDGLTTALSMAETYSDKAVAAYLRQHGAKRNARPAKP